MSNVQLNMKDSLQQLLDRSRVVVELGCGPNKRADVIGVDAVDLPGVDVVADVNQGLPFLPDASVDEVVANHLLEHLSNLEGMMSEITRVLKPDGICRVYVPYFSNPHYYSDYTHRTPWGLYTIGYFCKRGWPYSRHVPDFYNQVDIRLISQRLVFYSRYRLIRWPKKAVQLTVNSSLLFQELYEEMLAWAIPADGLEIVFRRPTSSGD